MKKLKKQKIWIITGDSESGDHYAPKLYRNNPTAEDKRNYIIDNTPESVDVDGPGDCGSYVHLTIDTDEI